MDDNGNGQHIEFDPETHRIIGGSLSSDRAREIGALASKATKAEREAAIEAEARTYVAESLYYAGKDWDTEVPAVVKAYARAGARGKTGSIRALENLMRELGSPLLAKQPATVEWDGRGACPTCGNERPIAMTNLALESLAAIMARLIADKAEAFQAAVQAGQPAVWDVETETLANETTRATLAYIRAARKNNPVVAERLAKSADVWPPA